MDHQKVYRLSISCLIMMIIATARAVMLFPPNIAPVCGGDELELTCAVSGRALEWNVSIPWMLPEFSTFKHSLTSVERSSPDHTITINGSNSFVFSRISPQDSQPLISRLLISPTTGAVNGTVIICTDRETRNSSSTRVYIVNNALPAEVNITSHLEKHNSNNVTVLLSLWTPLDQDMYSSLYSYQFSAVPPLEIQFAGRRSVRTQVLYNTLYNVSVTGVCVMNSIALYYANCGNLATIVENRSTLTIEYDYPALDVEGVSVTFSCSPGLMLSGPNASTCMRNGEWEPDPRDVECKDPAGTDVNDNTLIEAVVSSILATFLLTFFFTFIFGCICGICFRKKCNRRANTPCDITPVVYEDVIPIPSRRLQDQSVTLNQNVAYVPVVASSNL